MKLPREIAGRKLAHLLEKFGYHISRQAGSHMRLTTMHNGEHHITIPDHDSLRIGTLSGILSDVANHLKKEKSEIIETLF